MQLTPQQRSAIDQMNLTPPPVTDFRPAQGDSQTVKSGFLGFGKITGKVHPHKDAHLGTATAGKYLARIHVTKDYDDLGLKRGWNYWVLADLGGTLINVYYPEGSPAQYSARKMTPYEDPAHTHAAAKAEWRRNSSAAPWATCGSHMCCCDGDKCEAARAQF